MSTAATRNLRAFGRLGVRADVFRVAREAYDLGAKVEVGRDAGTVLCTFQGAEMFRALAKGEGVWLVIYSPEFYNPE